MNKALNILDNIKRSNSGREFVGAVFGRNYLINKEAKLQLG